MEYLIFQTEILQIFIGLVKSFVSIGVVISPLSRYTTRLFFVINVSNLVAIHFVDLVDGNVIELGQQSLPFLDFIVSVGL